ncbi:unnamed protein product, partial [Rotaria sp. Silwood2]
MSLFVSIILFLFVNNGLTIDCPNSPSKWCETNEIAQACDVVEQCQIY